jgi:hypothetical protein
LHVDKTMSPLYILIVGKVTLAPCLLDQIRRPPTLLLAIVIFLFTLVLNCPTLADAAIVASAKYPPYKK